MGKALTVWGGGEDRLKVGVLCGPLKHPTSGGPCPLRPVPLPFRSRTRDLPARFGLCFWIWHILPPRHRCGRPSSSQGSHGRPRSCSCAMETASHAGRASCSQPGGRPLAVPVAEEARSQQRFSKQSRAEGASVFTPFSPSSLCRSPLHKIPSIPSARGRQFRHVGFPRGARSSE